MGERYVLDKYTGLVSNETLAYSHTLCMGERYVLDKYTGLNYTLHTVISIMYSKGCFYYYYIYLLFIYYLFVSVYNGNNNAY